MVAYSFKACFVPQIATGLKLQTVRADRTRHARPCEPVQLYQGMRTRHCRKIVSPDPICTAVHPIVIETHIFGITQIELNGRKLDAEDAEAFAANDGFAPQHINALAFMDGTTALRNMARFWQENNGAGVFRGVVIYWTGGRP